MGEQKVLKRTVKIVANVLLYTFIVICLAAVVITITSKKEADGTATIFGRQIRTVLTASMEKCDETDVSGYDIKDIPVKSVVLIEVVPDDEEEAAKWYEELREGDVLTFKYVYVRQETITHRIIDKEPNGRGGYYIYLRGDNKNADSENLVQIIDTSENDSPNYIIGKVTATSHFFGVLMSALTSTAGLICIVIIPSFIIVILEVFKIANMLNAEKRKKVLEEKQQKQSEIDELKRKIAELEAKKRTK